MRSSCLAPALGSSHGNPRTGTGEGGCTEIFHEGTLGNFQRIILIRSPPSLPTLSTGSIRFGSRICCCFAWNWSNFRPDFGNTIRDRACELGTVGSRILLPYRLLASLKLFKRLKPRALCAMSNLEGSSTRNVTNPKVCTFSFVELGCILLPTA